MTYFDIFILALALAIDAITVGSSIAVKHRSNRQIFRIAFHFGLFQALFPLLGILAGSYLFNLVEGLAPVVSFSVLLLIGIKMIWDGAKDKKCDEGKDLTRGLSLVMLSSAVSIDAFGAGVSLAAGGVDIVNSVIIIGLVSTIGTAIAMKTASKLICKIGNKGEIIAGVVLIALGVKMLFV